MANEVQLPSLTDYVQAGYPCLFLPTVEGHVAEDRVKKALTAAGLNMSEIVFGVWKSTTGLMIAPANESMRPKKECDHLFEAIAFVESNKKQTYVLLHNIRQFINNPNNIQQFIDSCMSARLKGSCIILIGPHLDLPIELRNLVTFVSCPLPTQEQIAKEFETIINGYADELKDIPQDETEVKQLLKEAATAAVGLDSIGAENALALSLATSEKVDLRIIQAQKEQEVRKSDVLEFVGIEDTMADLGGYAAFKEWFTRRKRAFSEEARKYGLPFPKGVLIVGLPGSGKSLAAKVVASYLKLPLLRMDMGKVFRSLVGESEAAIRMALQVAEAVSPVVLWMDEIEKGMAGMRGSGDLDSGVSARVISTLLTWRQETKYPVMLVATANDVTALPSMVYRKGRMDEIWATDLPLLEERKEIVQIHLRKRDRKPAKFDINLLAMRTDGFVGSEIESVIEDAMFAAFDQEREVTSAHILQAIRDTIPQSERDKEELAAIREWVSTRARMVSGGEKPDKKEKKNSKVRKMPRIGG